MILVTINILLTFVFLSCFISCTSAIKPQEKTVPFHWNRKDKPPALVILPFDNNTDTKDIEVMFRRSFADHVNAKNYRDLKLSEIDESLNILQHSLGKQWKMLSPMDLGKLFHCDFLIYGEVNKFSRIFLGLYSQNALGVELKMVGTNYGQVIWQEVTVVRSHQGGIPFSPFGLIPEIFRCSYHLTEEQKIILVEKTCRELIKEMPNSPNPMVSVFIVAIQVASFNKKDRAAQILKELKAKGYAPRMEKVVIGNRKWYRVIVGPYYDKEEAEMVKKLIARDHIYQPIFILY